MSGGLGMGDARLIKRPIRKRDRFGMEWFRYERRLQKRHS
jgi:hypothetical protein